MLRCSALCVLVGLLVAVPACSTPASPAENERAQIPPLWKEGQTGLFQVNDQWVAEGQPPIQGDILSVTSVSFHFVPHGDPIYLEGEQVGGYFDPNSRSIHYYEPLMEASIPHETGHAILHELGDPRWVCVFHSGCAWPQ